jgi:hypothetical protein
LLRQGFGKTEKIIFRAGNRILNQRKIPDFALIFFLFSNFLFLKEKVALLCEKCFAVDEVFFRYYLARLRKSSLRLSSPYQRFCFRFYFTAQKEKRGKVCARHKRDGCVCRVPHRFLRKRGGEHYRGKVNEGVDEHSGFRFR